MARSVGLQSLLIISTMAVCRSVELTDISCDFDGPSGMCGWINAMSVFDQLDWTLHRGATLTSNTGPHADHTTGSGQYIYLETSYPSTATDGDYAILMSPVVPATTNDSTGCLTFWYHMLGKTIGRLSVFLVDAGEMGGHLVWRMEGEQGGNWSMAALPIYYTKPFMIIIQGQIMRPVLTDMALDDLRYEVLPPDAAPCRLSPLGALAPHLETFFLRPPTTPAPVTTYMCEECAGAACEMGLENVTCPDSAPFCSSHIRESGSSPSQHTVVKGCMSRDNCEKGRVSDARLAECLRRINQTSTGAPSTDTATQPASASSGSSVAASTTELDCLFCCMGNLCNQGPALVPPQSSWLEERNVPSDMASPPLG